MHPELTNLLPEERRASLARDYWFRLGTLAALLLALIMVAHGALLFPSYLYLKGQATIQADRLAALSEARAASGYEDVAARLAALSATAEGLAELSGVSSGSDAIRAVLDIPRTGISLHSFILTPVEVGAEGKMTLSGTALTRESLRVFDRALGELPFVRSTNLPLSAYAKERDIPFTIDLVLSDTP